MTQKKSDSVSKNKAINAFKYAACEMLCKVGGNNRKVRVEHCITGTGGCVSYKTFIKKLD